ncbi:hypothetical protein [Pelagerythrobacter rhizovicinus]|uniref:Uncharacterized protein n=1 Tax=Pelagerythrobacter rhizovicinus TaxID=2268576 RepID=A0A4Q2KMD6_9SPHN|nr:hypothetical protein [Pelagerythrobacter rhizovicinus]RXZ65420.1 hypothetical protein ETX26_01275 [Pelagerythrobacter rhizovicinus]
MADDAKKPTQAVPDADQNRKSRAPDGVSSQAHRDATGGSDDAAPYPSPHSAKPEDEREDVADGWLSHGGQSSNAYHGTGRLGEQKTAPDGNPNAGAGKDQ